jgi:hypothetical protein
MPNGNKKPSNNNNNNNLTNENIKNLKPVNVNELVKIVKEKGRGNSPLPSHPLLNMKDVPKMKLPPHLQGGKRRTQRRRTTKRKHTRKN